MTDIINTSLTASLSTEVSTEDLKKLQFFQTFEPKTSNRFICYIKDKEKNTLVPAFILKKVTRPKVTRTIDENTKKITWEWHPIEIETYDPIVPSATEIFVEYIKNPKPFDMCIKILGPVGDVVEEWEITNAEITEINFGTLDWSSCSADEKSKISGLNVDYYHKGGEPVTVKAKISYNYATLKY